MCAQRGTESRRARESSMHPLCSGCVIAWHPDLRCFMGDGEPSITFAAVAANS